MSLMLTMPLTVPQMVFAAEAESDQAVTEESSDNGGALADDEAETGAGEAGGSDVASGSSTDSTDNTGSTDTSGTNSGSSETGSSKPDTNSGSGSLTGETGNAAAGNAGTTSDTDKDENKDKDGNEKGSLIEHRASNNVLPTIARTSDDLIYKSVKPSVLDSIRVANEGKYAVVKYYDVSLKYGKRVGDGGIEVSFFVGREHDGKVAHIKHYSDDGSKVLDSKDVIVKDGRASMVVKSLSPFSVAVEKGEGQPATGDYSMTFVYLLAGLAAVSMAVAVARKNEGV